MTLRGNRKFWPHEGSVLVTGPTKEVVLLDELKKHARVETNESDEFLDRLIIEARQELEDISGLALLSQTWQMTLDSWPGHRDQWWDGVRQLAITEIDGGPQNEIEIIRYPIISIDTINVYDRSDVVSAVTIADTFDIDITSRPGRIALQPGAVWPIATRSIKAIEINYTAGYGTSVSDVPTPLARAIRNMAAYMYDHRGSGCDGDEAYSMSGAKAIVERYRVARL